MNAVIPDKLRNGSTSFTKLVGYISVRDDKPKGNDLITDAPTEAASQSKQAVFDRLVDYIDRSGSDLSPIQVTEDFPDGRQRVTIGDVPCETNCFSWETSAAEMNGVASKNRRCVDPVYHFILSWREHEAPTNAQVFESAKHCIEALGMDGHQYVTAIHHDTDNLHCHVAVNRVHPLTFKASNVWNDVEKLQKSCRILERRYGFEQDNGSWVWNDNDKLVPAGFRYPSAPQGAAKTEIFSDKESLFHYTVRTVRDEMDELFGRDASDWQSIHLLLNQNGLALREQGRGLVVFDKHNPEGVAVKASSVHPALTKGRLEPVYGAFVKTPSFDSTDPFESRYGEFNTYQPTLQLRDKGARAERREERAAERDALKTRYQQYRNAWVKPDLNVAARQQDIAARFQSMKLNARRSFNDPLLRKLMYRVAEFERMKAMAELRLQLRQERQALAAKGAYRPLAYKVWVEQEALAGDVAAVSQLRGFAYREKRKAKQADRHAEGAIIFAAADDTGVLDRRSHATQLRRDGTIEYLRYGRVGVVDKGDQVVIKTGFEDVDQEANLRMAAGLASTKSGDHIEIVGKPEFVEEMLYAGALFNEQYKGENFTVTQADQLARLGYLESVTAETASDLHGVRSADRFEYDDNLEVDQDSLTWNPKI
jgi:hypothetical protein